jgi:hypothetical protein
MWELHITAVASEQDVQVIDGKKVTLRELAAQARLVVKLRDEKLQGAAVRELREDGVGNRRDKRQSIAGTRRDSDAVALALAIVGLVLGLAFARLPAGCRAPLDRGCRAPHDRGCRDSLRSHLVDLCRACARVYTENSANNK